MSLAAQLPDIIVRLRQGRGTPKFSHEWTRKNANPAILVCHPELVEGSQSFPGRVRVFLFPAAAFLLKRMEGRQVQLPANRDYWPDQDALGVAPGTKTSAEMAKVIANKE